MELYVIIVCLAILVLFLILAYNALIGARNSVNEAFSTMDVYLKQRWDLIPNLVECVKSYMEHEKSILEEVTKIRSSMYEGLSQQAKIEANKKITTDLSKLFALAENYPELKANTVFLDLQEKLTKVEDDIAYSRKYYNANVRDLNNKIQMFPTNIIASMFGFKEAKMFEIDEAQREPIKVSF